MPGVLFISNSHGVLDLQCEAYDSSYLIGNIEKFGRCDGSVFHRILGNCDDHFVTTQFSSDFFSFLINQNTFHKP